MPLSPVRLTLLLIIARIAATTAVAQTPFTLLSARDKLIKNYPEIIIYQADSANVIARRDVQYCCIGRRVLACDIFVPQRADTSALPLAIIVHGGGWLSGDKSMDNEIAKTLVHNGFAAMCVDYRKSGEALYPAAVQDIRCAIRWARLNAGKYHFDPRRFALIGSSAGGQMAALIGAVNGDYDSFDNDIYAGVSSHVACVIDIDGVLSFIHPDSGEGCDKPGKPSSATLWFGCTAADNPELWNEASATHHVSAQSADFLIIRGCQPRFTAGFCEMADSLRKYGRRAEIRTLDDAPHTFWLFEPWAEQTIEYILSWLREL